MEIKNRLVGRLAKVQADVQAFNSVPQGQAVSRALKEHPRRMLRVAASYLAALKMRPDLFDGHASVAGGDVRELAEKVVRPSLIQPPGNIMAASPSIIPGE